MTTDSLMQQMIAAGVDIMNPQAVYDFFHDIDYASFSVLVQTWISEAVASKIEKNEVTQMLQGKLNRDEFHQFFKGAFVSADALKAQVTDPVPGDYANVDAGPGEPADLYIYDADDNDWHKQASGIDLTQLSGLVQTWITNAVATRALQADLDRSDQVHQERLSQLAEAKADRAELTALDNQKADKQAVAEQLASKVNSAEYQQHFKGLFPSYTALKAQVLDAVAGDYANVDAGEGMPADLYLYDIDDQDWSKQSSRGLIVSSSDSVPEGNKNLYFTEQRVLDAMAPLMGQVNDFIDQILGESP